MGSPQSLGWLRDAVPEVWAGFTGDGVATGGATWTGAWAATGAAAHKAPATAAQPTKRAHKLYVRMEKTSGRGRRRHNLVSLDALGQTAACRDLPGSTVGQLTAFQVHLDLSAPQMPANELFGEGILDVTLDGATERTCPV
jgi:hypothetical protein